MKILLSPAKTIDTDRYLQTDMVTVPQFLSEANSLVAKLKKFSAKKIGKLMDLSPELADLNAQRYQQWEPVTELKGSGVHVAAAFNGEAYRGLDAITLTKSELEVAQSKLRILSGLYGVLKPMDVICPYRLEMGTSWAVTPTKKNLYQFWGNKVVDALNAEEQEVIVNVASSEYFKVLPQKKIKARVITAVFKEFKNGEYKVIMVFAKKARGMMALYIIQHDINDPELIKGFSADGYRFDANLSSENEWVFTR